MPSKQGHFAAMLGAGILMLGVPTVIAMQQPASAQQAGQATSGTLIAALNNIAVELNNLEALNDLTVQDVQILKVEDVLNGNNVEAFNNALNQNNVEIITLRSTLNNNELINNVLINNNVEVGQVVAVEVLRGGDVIVFYQEKTPRAIADT